MAELHSRGVGKRLCTVVAAGSLLVLVGASAATAQTGIAGSPHDFSGTTWAAGEICGVCHTPHNGNTTVSDAPLWNHEVSTATYTLYSSTTLDASPSQPSGASKLCLSCHDGTVALDNYSGNTGSNFIAPPDSLGTDLSNDHPISFTYDAALASTDGGLWDPTDVTHTTALGGTIQADLLLADQVQCSSCHDVHNQYNHTHLLKIDNASSALCLTCHNK